MSADEELGYVYLPVGSPSHNWYGGHRFGTNLYSSSLVALDVETGEPVWHYQLVHHSIWDYDPVAAPNLIDITVDGREIRAVAQVTKQGFLFVFDRVTGEPVWPMEEQPVPQSIWGIWGEGLSAGRASRSSRRRCCSPLSTGRDRSLRGYTLTTSRAATCSGSSSCRGAYTPTQ